MIYADTPLEYQSLGALVQHAAAQALQHESVDSNVDLGIVLADDDHLQELNRDYRGIDAPTDVLAFPASEPDPETGALYLGDVVLSTPRAEEQARAAGHSLEAEVQLLVVHGVLHLLGHDHAGEAEKARMWAAQAEILAGLGLSDIKIPEK
jgi:probable rRNA maturation factor